MLAEYVTFAARCILAVKFFATAPIYFARMVNPDLMANLPWCMGIDAFHHFEARVFYLLALYRASLQLYFSANSSKKAFRYFLALEVLLEGTVLGIFCAEYYDHGMKPLSHSTFFAAQLTATICMAFLHHRNRTMYSAEKHII